MKDRDTKLRFGKRAAIVLCIVTAIVIGVADFLSRRTTHSWEVVATGQRSVFVDFGKGYFELVHIHSCDPEWFDGLSPARRRWVKDYHVARERYLIHLLWFEALGDKWQLIDRLVVRAPVLIAAFLAFPGFIAGRRMWKAIALQRQERRTRQERGCGTCGYDLTGNMSGVCPECGTQIVAKRPHDS